MTSILFIQTASPHGRINAQEGLDALLMGSAFTQCGLLFVGDAHWQLVREQVPAEIGRKDFTRSFGALADYGVTEIYCEQQFLHDNQLVSDELLLPAQPLSSGQIRQLLSAFDKVLNF